MSQLADRLVSISEKLAHATDQLKFAPPVSHVYNPLQYAWPAYEQYLRKYTRRSCQVVFLGMNPGPWGMAQTGVPFGEVSQVRDWLKIDAPIGRPNLEHAKRPIQGYDCPRSEVSGQRLWSLFRKRFVQPKAFFAKHMILNYCPLVFMGETARNLTPDKLPIDERRQLESLCDLHLLEFLSEIKPKWLIGVGVFAEKCALRVQAPGVEIARILHPSPASPAANRGWAETATKQLIEIGIWEK